MFLVAERYLYIINPQTHDWWGNHTCVFQLISIDFKVTGGGCELGQFPAVHKATKGSLRMLLMCLFEERRWGSTCIKLILFESFLKIDASKDICQESKLFLQVMLIIFILVLSGGSSLYNLAMYEVIHPFHCFIPKKSKWEILVF